MTEQPPKSPKPRLRRSLQAVAGTSALIIGLLSLLLPSPYLIETPGPVFNTIGEIEDEAVISVTGEPTYPTDGALNLTTVYVSGEPTSTVRVPEAVLGWVNPGTDIQPHELIYPSGTTAEQVQEQNSAAMTSSQDLAVAAALQELGIDYSQQLSVVDFTPEADEVGTDEQLQPGDTVTAAAGSDITGLEGLRDAVNTAAGQPVELTVRREGEELEYEVPTYQEADGAYYVGIMLQNEFSFPVDVDIQLDGVGGPSAGLMFTLGLVDSMTEESMTGGVNWAGTGTVDPDGTVGPIGGIAQKVVGARSQGIENFLVPSENCADLEGRVPEGLQTYSVADVSEARQIVEAVRDEDEDFLAGLTSCGSQ
ncbi:YlbL family protein [Nesterenkonia halotolerans]|uniref:PDZ domain-containing protein n=1 Tax=Nesterenkonia halotolerans TaxID=225325 RepID=A0ABR9J642_9MICC|nr:S16 family serine protease [Nesterenkonia halotolerans]MBE1514317.1 PDZ domain-containing protein [Nesterenkonia halotolerans]